MKKTGIAYIGMLLSPFLFAGCTHQMEIINIPDSPFVSGIGVEPVEIGIVNQGSDNETGGYIEAIAKSLQTNGNVKRVVYPYLQGHDVDVIAYVYVEPIYKGSWVIYFITWPGFLIWTPAWHGFNYSCNVKTTFDLIANGEQVGHDSWEYLYKFRQADIGRT